MVKGNKSFGLKVVELVDGMVFEELFVVSPIEADVQVFRSFERIIFKPILLEVFEGETLRYPWLIFVNFSHVWED